MVKDAMESVYSTPAKVFPWPS